MKRRPGKTDFSDTAKRARGVEPRDLATEIKALHQRIEDERTAHDAIAARTRERIRDAIRAFEDGRRGDGMAILRALVRTKDGKLALPDDAEPPRCA